MTSAAARPNIRSPAGLSDSMTPASSKTIRASPTLSMIARRRASLARWAARARLRSSLFSSPSAQAAKSASARKSSALSVRGCVSMTQRVP
jgi:hypothetical protein